MSGKRSLVRLLLILFCFTGYKASSTHIVGGELYYRNLGNSNYEVTLIVYRDCFYGVPPFDDPASVGIYDNPFYNLIADLRLHPIDSILLPPSITSPCFVPPVNICYRKAIYMDTVFLPSNGSGYWLVYQRCCRNNTILNIVNPEDRGATYTAFIPGTTTFSQNSNPVFTSLPPTFICQNLPFTFDHSATDAEGDSIVYEICNPLDYAGFQGAPMPQPPDPPPYQDVPWLPPYDLSNVLGGVPMEIDPSTGVLTCTPNTIGQFVFSICAREFRGGIYLSTTRRDYQVNVVPCNTIVVAAIQDPILSCDDQTVTFLNLSVNAGSYSWNFGDPTSTADTSSAFQPVYTYPDTGAYTAQLIAYSPINTLCNDTITGTVNVYPGYAADAGFTTQVCSPEVQFTDTTLSSVYTTVGYYWDFNDGTTSTQADPAHIYSSPGLYNVTFIATSEKGCTDTISLPVPLNYLDVTVANNTPVRCKGECNGEALAVTATGFPPYYYQWNDPANQSTALADSLCPGTYSVIMTDSAGCIDTAEVIITEPDLLLISASALSDYCNHACAGYGIATATGGNSGYTWTWNDPSSQTTSTADHLCEGQYTVIVTDSKGCTDSVMVSVNYIDSVPQVNALANPEVIYPGQSSALSTINTVSNIYLWTPSGNLNNASIYNPVATPSQTTEYLVEVTDTNGCKVSDTTLVTVREARCSLPSVFVPNTFTPNNDGENDVLYVRGGMVKSLYFAVYDRWGEIIFETENQSTGWNGYYKGEAAQPGVYVYYLNAVCWDESDLTLKGNVTLLK